MTVSKLTRDQIIELKQNYLSEKIYNEGERCISWGELADADELVSDETIFAEYGGYDFSVDDFFCTAGDYELQERLEG